MRAHRQLTARTGLLAKNRDYTHNPGTRVERAARRSNTDLALAMWFTILPPWTPPSSEPSKLPAHDPALGETCVFIALYQLALRQFAEELGCSFRGENFTILHIAVGELNVWNEHVHRLSQKMLKTA